MKRRYVLWGALLLALLTMNGCLRSSAVLITFGGDVMLARNGIALFARSDPWGDAGTYLNDLQVKNPQAMFLVNLESPFSENFPVANSIGYNLCSDAAQIAILKSAHVDMVSLVNNHNLDCAADGLAQTVRILEKNSISFAGAGYSPTITDMDGMRVGVIAVEDVTAPVDQQKLISAIREARKQCDFLLVSMHWGNEYQAGVREDQQEMAQSIADAGADVLWGHHPHVLQKMEWLQSTSGDHRMLAIYSLGNLLSDQGMSKDTQSTALISLKVENGRITQIQVHPFVMDVYEMKLRDADADESREILDRLNVGQLSGVELVLL